MPLFSSRYIYKDFPGQRNGWPERYSASNCNLSPESQPEVKLTLLKGGLCRWETHLRRIASTRNSKCPALLSKLLICASQHDGTSPCSAKQLMISLVKSSIQPSRLDEPINQLSSVLFIVEFLDVVERDYFLGAVNHSFNVNITFCQPAR